MVKMLVISIISLSLNLRAELTEAQNKYVENAHTIAEQWRAYDFEYFENILFFLKPMGMIAMSGAGLSFQALHEEDASVSPALNKMSFWTMATILGCSVASVILKIAQLSEQNVAMQKIIDSFEIDDQIIQGIEKQEFLDDIQTIKYAKEVMKKRFQMPKYSDFVGWGY